MMIKEAYETKLRRYLKDLEELSKKHGLWIEEDEQNAGCMVVDNYLVPIAFNLTFDGEKQAYTLKIHPEL